MPIRGNAAHGYSPGRECRSSGVGETVGHKRGAGLAIDDLAPLVVNELSIPDGNRYGCAAKELIRLDGSAEVVNQWLKKGRLSEHHH